MQGREEKESSVLIVRKNMITSMNKNTRIKINLIALDFYDISNLFDLKQLKN